MGGGRQVGDEFLEFLHVRRDAFQDEIHLARQHPAFPHQGLGAHEILERPQISLRLARQMDGGEHGDVEAEPARVEQSAVALDVALLLQRAHPAQAGRWRDADALGQLDIGDSAVGLDLAQDFEIDLIKILRHVNSGVWNCKNRAAGPTATLLAQHGWNAQFYYACSAPFLLLEGKIRRYGLQFLHSLPDALDLDLTLSAPSRCLSGLIPLWRWAKSLTRVTARHVCPD